MRSTSPRTTAEIKTTREAKLEIIALIIFIKPNNFIFSYPKI